MESLSDLIFGLALSIGALTLIGTAPANFQSLLLSIVYFAFSFLILISVWRIYSSTMSDMHIETRRDVNLNIVLLFLVSIEPFLFNEMFSPSIPTQNVSILYALDIGGLFTIQAFLASSILTEKNRPGELLLHYRRVRNWHIIAALCFFISALPVFWTSIPIGSEVNIHIRYLLWIAFLFLSLISRLFEKKDFNLSGGSIPSRSPSATPRSEACGFHRPA
jgi:uncharacterized membrane protein